MESRSYEYYITRDHIILLKILWWKKYEKLETVDKSLAFHNFVVTQNFDHAIPANIYLYKFNNRNTRKRCERCSKLTIKTPELRHWRRPGVFIDFTPFSSVSIVHFEHINLSWDTDVHYTFYTKETLAYPKYWKHSKFAPGFARSNVIITLS